MHVDNFQNNNYVTCNLLEWTVLYWNSRLSSEVKPERQVKKSNEKEEILHVFTKVIQRNIRKQKDKQDSDFLIK